MVNPYYTYILTFLICFLLYLLNWSDLFPAVNASLILFFLFNFIVAFYIGAKFQINKWISYKAILPRQIISRTTLFIYFLWAIEFIYAGGIPLFQILRGIEYNYVEFGVPSLHIFVVTFNSFFAVYVFHLFLSTREKRLLYTFFLLLIPGLLVFNRGMLLMNITSCVFVFLLSRERLKLQITRKLIFYLFIILFIFGVLGNVRLSHSVGEKYNRNLILDISKADKNFVSSFVPKEFFWTYLYGASPVANLQNNILKNKEYSYSFKNLLLFFNSEYLPDFISKRVNNLIGHTRRNYELIAPFLTVATVYSRGFSYLGWIGLFLINVFIFIFPFLYLSIIRKKNDFFVTGVSILNTMYFYMVYDNMFAFTGLCFQLIYPVIFPYFLRLRFKTQ